jgi:hypothetical protein
MERLSKLEERLEEGSAKLAELQSQIRDIEFLNEQLREQKLDRTREPKLSIMALVETRMCDRDVLGDFARRMAFLRVETAEMDRAINRSSEFFSAEANARARDKNELMHRQLKQLKLRFRSQRAVKEGRVLALTCEDDLRFVHERNRAVLSDLDVCRMRKSALQAKIIKRTRMLKQRVIRVPPPPDAQQIQADAEKVGPATFLTQAA